MQGVWCRAYAGCRVPRGLHRVLDASFDVWGVGLRVEGVGCRM